VTKALVACETLRDELEHALREATGRGNAGEIAQICWIESGLHNTPDLLRERLQETLDGITGCDFVLMAFGRCGEALDGLETGDYELILPAVADCISLLLGSDAKRLEVSQRGGTYFLTRGWLRGERTIWAEHEYALRKFGEKRAEAIRSAMLGNYRYLATLDTDSYDLESILGETRKIAGGLKLEHTVIPASIAYLKDLLSGPPWEEPRFLRFLPRQRIGFSLALDKAPLF
jgi:hypothetical protein